MSKAIFVFTPSHKQQKYLEKILDSISSNITIDYQFCLFTDKVNDDFNSKYNLVIKTIESSDLKKLENIYFKEGRSDIPAFSAYAQFILPRYFSEYSSFLYMEVDQIVKGDLAPLWQECNKSDIKIASAIGLDEDFKPVYMSSFHKLYPKERYFCTGVLYVNTIEWINNKFENKCFQEAELQKKSNGKRYDFYAQGAINNALTKYMYEFSWKYNATGFGHIIGIKKEFIEKAIVIHWTGSRKPWVENGLYKDLYFNDNSYFTQEDYIKEFSLFKFIKKTIKKFIGVLK